MLPTALAITLLRQRTLLGYITDGGGNVDLGALLARLSAATTGPLKARADAALAAYRAVVVSFQRDGELADVSARAGGCCRCARGHTACARWCTRTDHCTSDAAASHTNTQGTGMAIYFPEDLMSMDARYGPFVSGDTAALSAWLTFLQGLYSTTASLLEGAPLSWSCRRCARAALSGWVCDAQHGCLPCCHRVCTQAALRLPSRSPTPCPTRRWPPGRGSRTAR